MKFIDNRGITDPTINLAMEEYVLHHIPVNDNYFLFYVNSPSIIIGKNQEALDEFNDEYITEKNIQVIRRLSGGGTVYQDLGNLNFSFISSYEGYNLKSYKEFVQPIVNALNTIGIAAELNSRNDIYVNDRKISGNAQYAKRGRMLSHGTLLLNSDLNSLINALRVKEINVNSKAIKSVRSAVANINEFLPSPLSMDQFKGIILKAVFEANQKEINEYLLSEEDWKKIYKISEERYKQREWNYILSSKKFIKY